MKALTLGVVTVFIAVATSTCSDESKKSSPEDYVAQFVEGASQCEPEATPATIDDLVDGLEVISDAFDGATPPDGIEEAHAAYASAIDDVTRRIEGFENISDLRDDEDLVELVAVADEAHDEWNDAVEKVLGVRLFTNEGASMEPAFSAGDAFAFQPFDGSVGRWDLIVFEYPLDRKRTFFKRIVGLPGETVEVRNEVILVDGTPIVGDEYALANTNYEYGPRVVPAGSYFVLGDNRRNSFDSHAWGNACAPDEECDFVPADAILGELPADTVGGFCDDLGGTAVPSETS